MPDDRAIRVFLVDDHEVVRAGMAAMLDANDDLEVVGQCGSAAEALDAVIASEPDVAVLDVRLGDGSGIEVCREIRAARPEVGCLMLTSFADDRALVDAGLAGAAGFVLKEVRGDEIVAAIRKVADGAVLLDQAVVRVALERLRRSGERSVEELTPQERRIFDLIGKGLSNREIAEEMFLAEKTVKNYVSNLLAKLGMRRRTEAAAFAARLEERERGRGT
jgi:DNA-binding NarL/FixJ family response regulator